RESADDDSGDARGNAGAPATAAGLMRGSTIAWLAAATHVVASAAMLFLLREGLPGFDEAHRVAYLEANRSAWIGGWFTWQLAVLSLIALYSALTIRFESAVA